MLTRPRIDLSHLGDKTFADFRTVRNAPQKGAGPSRREVKAEKRSDEAKYEKAWHKGITKRDGDECRWCRRKVVSCMDRLPERREHHHVSGRVVVAIRWDVRNGIQLCGTCHDRVTGKVGEKAVIESRYTYTVDEIAYINANRPVRFKRIA